MKRIFVLAVLALVAFGLLGMSGCSKKVTRDADVAAGDYYTEEEFARLSKDQRDAYCADLSSELDELERETDAARSRDTSRRNADLRRELAEMQSQIQATAGRADAIQREINYYESLPTSYSVVRGDCLWRISGKEQIYADPVKWPRLYRANRDQIENADLIYPDMVLAVPRDWPDQHRVVRGEWLSKIAGYWEVYGNFRKWPSLYEANRDQIQDPDLIYPDQILDIPR